MRTIAASVLVRDLALMVDRWPFWTPQQCLRSIIQGAILHTISDRRTYGVPLAVFFIATSLSISASAQAAVDNTVPSPTLALAPAPVQSTGDAHSSQQVTLLPDAPSASSTADYAPSSTSGTRVVATGLILPMPQASHTTAVIEPNQDAPVLTAGDKVLLGLKDAVSPAAVLGWFTVAGYEQITNGSPNYGTDRGAFGRRLGDAAIRDSSETILSASVMSPIFHEDPRYYRLGPTHNFFARLVYAGTRPLITRTDSGHNSLNLALLTGTMGGSALTNLYYPQANRGAVQTLETFDGSVAGSALGDIVSEFYGDLIHRLRPIPR
jgi:hypothetical protein